MGLNCLIQQTKCVLKVNTQKLYPNLKNRLKNQSDYKRNNKKIDNPPISAAG
ncbi:hypothetical protein PITCH_A1700007 [uncultured Desulfobacterium sp.]|uniref:Uncharacterized protein n=1 Tax=uncultured Desulfobacterium sp. TaxID=201089 RepID=A0A445MUV1_9BACT|nr:hypothetical protein PITCH_A1700007 [uncultured Desulfobacterium sp.]